MCTHEGSTCALLSAMIKAVLPGWELTLVKNHRDERGEVTSPRSHSWYVAELCL